MINLGDYLRSWQGDVDIYQTDDGLAVSPLYAQYLEHLAPVSQQADPRPWRRLAGQPCPSPPALPASSGLPIYSAGLHYGEELQLGRPVGAVFLRGCVVGCNFCLDYTRVFADSGPRYDRETVLHLLRALEVAGAEALDLVNPDLWATPLIEILHESSSCLPVIWNTHGYHTRVQELRGLVDIYLIDCKFSNQLGAERTRVPDYLDRCLEAIEQSLYQVGHGPGVGERWHRGTMIRYLAMPDSLDDASHVFQALADLDPRLTVHIMNQWVPPGTRDGTTVIGLPEQEYEAVCAEARYVGLTNLIRDTPF